MKKLCIALLGIICGSCASNSNEIIRQNPTTLYNPSKYGFTQTIKVPAKGEYVFVSGQLGSKKEDREFSTNFRTQVKNTIQNVIYGLEANDVSTEDVVKITVLIVDHDNEKLEILTEEFLKVWGEKNPTSTLIPVPKLALDGMLIEIDALAYKK
ncbi:RidA family protein [Aureivirga marina]|uniref:RidA family protein n=1 Tax=Aureivirga marina TaxID=1182451 RepID=UPI0018CA50B8|nr:RidA family protein [Aureivirga marina]